MFGLKCQAPGPRRPSGPCITGHTVDVTGGAYLGG